MAERQESNSAPVALKHADGDGKAVHTKLGRRTEIVIGRDLECDVVIKDVKASRKHCRLVRKGDGFILEDLGSKNGTFVGGERISNPAALKPDQTFKIGDTIFYLSH